MREEHYNIKDLEKLTGIKAHTIRIWEKRHNLLEPKRTDTNIRYYTAEDLKKLLNISILNKNGLKVSKIAELSPTEITERVIELTSRNSEAEDKIQALIMAMFQLNTQKFEKLITISYINRGFENTFKEIILPFFIKIGYLWQTGTITPAQEHFASNILYRKITVAIDGILANYNEQSKKILMFLPEGEYHEVGLLYTHYLLKKQNHLVTYLGTSIPFASIDEINALHQSNYLITVFTSVYSPETIEQYLKQLSKSFSNQTILVSGAQMAVFNLTLPENVRFIDSPENLLEYIQTQE